MWLRKIDLAMRIDIWMVTLQRVLEIGVIIEKLIRNQNMVVSQKM